MYKYKSPQAGQLPQEHLSFLQNLLNFMIKKYLKQDFDTLSISINEHSPWGFSVTEDIKIYQCHVVKSNGITPNGEVPYRLPSRSCFCCLNLTTAAPVTRDKEICQSRMIIR